MTNEQLKEKMARSQHDCETCEFRLVPLRIEPCKSCSDTQDNWEADLRKVKEMLK